MDLHPDLFGGETALIVPNDSPWANVPGRSDHRNWKGSELDLEAQEELYHAYLAEGEDPDDWRCRSCGVIYDGGIRCTYCGDPNPTGEDD